MKRVARQPLFLDSSRVSCQSRAYMDTDMDTLDIKICGLKTPEAIAAALGGGASHVGFIFFPKSPRHIEPEDAATLREAARGKALAVAVTVDADDGLLDRIVAAMRCRVVEQRASRVRASVRQHFLKRDAVFFDVLVYSGCSASRFPSARSD